jgi:hypothetical protein
VSTDEMMNTAGYLLKISAVSKPFFQSFALQEPSAGVG